MQESELEEGTLAATLTPQEPSIMAEDWQRFTVEVTYNGEVITPETSGCRIEWMFAAEPWVEAYDLLSCKFWVDIPGEYPLCVTVILGEQRVYVETNLIVLKRPPASGGRLPSRDLRRSSKRPAPQPPRAISH